MGSRVLTMSRRIPSRMLKETVVRGVGTRLLACETLTEMTEVIGIFSTLGLMSPVSPAS